MHPTRDAEREQKDLDLSTKLTDTGEGLSKGNSPSTMRGSVSLKIGKAIFAVRAYRSSISWDAKPASCYPA